MPSAVEPASCSPSLVELLGEINQVAEPLIKLGLGSPVLFSPGVTVLEVAGRVSGQVRSTPLACWQWGNLLLIGTVRRNSQWIKNLIAAGDGAVWLLGQRLPATVSASTEHAVLLLLGGGSVSDTGDAAR